MITIENAKYATSDRDTIKVTINGKVIFVPIDPDNSHYKEILAQEITIAEPT